MKRIPAGILLLTLALATPILPRLQAEESAEQLADDDLGTSSNTQDESASQLSNQELGSAPNTPDESAGQLSNQDLGPDQKMADESAANLAEKQGLENKPKVVESTPPSEFGAGEGVNGVIYATTALPDGSIVVGGNFDAVNGQPRENLACFKPDGTLDNSAFASATAGVDGTVYALAIDSKGNLLVGGYFTVDTDQGDPLQNFVRFIPGGKLDAAFAAGLSPNGAVYAITVQPKGQIVVGGEFSQAGPQPRKNLVRYKVDGTLDGAITSAEASTGAVRSLTTLAGGGIIAGGALEIAGQSARNILVAP